MTSVKEYIDLLFDKLNELVIEDISYSDYGQMTDWLGEIRRGVNALEKKQEPMKPYFEHEYFCSGCASETVLWADYCWHCGQKLDWEE